MIHRALMHITRNRPMKQIDVAGEPYLQRFYMGSVFGHQVWLHRFLSGDGDRHSHNHPFNAISIVLRGGYSETFGDPRIPGDEVWRTRLAFGLPALIGIDHIHRIDTVLAGTWTLMLVGRRRKPFWWFVNAAGEQEFNQSSKPDWWKSYGPRPASGVR